jgi:hypothetical protein
MPTFPGLVLHNNANEPIVDLTGNQVKGLGVFASISGTTPSRNSLSASIRSEGYIAVITGLDKAYMYTSASILDIDWQNTANWIEIGSGSTYTLPIASASTLGGIKVGTNLSIDGSGVLSATDTNTTYTAGNGLTLSGTEFNVGGTTNRITVTADTVDIASTYIGQTSITTLGTITTGTWQGSQIADGYLSSITGTKVIGNIGGNAVNVTGTVAIANGGTGANTAPAARTNLGATTVGSNLFTLTNPGAIAFPRINADNTVNALSAADFRTAIGAGTGDGTVTSVGISVPTGLSVLNTPVTGSGTIAISLASGYSIPTTTSQTNWNTAFTDRLKWDGSNAGLNASTARTSLGLVINTDVQAYDADLAAIAALAGTSGLLRKTAADTWSLDTSVYITGNQTITLSGDVTGFGTTSIITTLSNSGVTADTYKSVTVDAKGRVTNGTNPTTLSGYGITDAQPLDADLTAIAALSGASGLLKKTASNTWELDTTTYLSGTVAIANGGTNATTEAGARGNILPDYSGNIKKVLRVNSTETDVEWSCISKDMFCSPNTSPSTANHIVTNVYRDGQWREIEVNGLYSSTGTVTVANDAVVIKNVNGKTPTNGAIKIYSSDIERTSTNATTVSQSLIDVEAAVTEIEDKIKYIVSEPSDGKFEYSTTGGRLTVSENTGSLSKNNTGYFFSEASPGIAEIKVQDESVTPVSRVAIKAVGVGSGARVGVHNTSPAYPLDITGNTRVTGNIIVTGTVDGVDVSELKNTVDNLTVGGTEEIELFSYFIS